MAKDHRWFGVRTKRHDAAAASAPHRGKVPTLLVVAAGTLLLAASSLVGALAPDALVLILARVAQGLGGAALLACGLGLIGHAFSEGAARARATAVWGAALGGGVAIGPILAAGLAVFGGWRLPYAATALAAAVLAVAGRTLLPRLLIAGAANGVLNAALGFQAVASVPADRAAMGGGAHNTARYAGSALGIAVITVLITHAGAAAGAAGVVAGWTLAALLTAGVSLLGAVVVLLAYERRDEAEPVKANGEPRAGRGVKWRAQRTRQQTGGWVHPAPRRHKNCQLKTMPAAEVMPAANVRR